MTDAERLFDVLIARRGCPQCGVICGYYAGPRGGMSTNIYCRNVECRQGFNVTPISVGYGIAERIDGPPSQEFYDFICEKYPRVWSLP